MQDHVYERGRLQQAEAIAAADRKTVILRYDLARSALLMLIAFRSRAVAAVRDAAVLDD